MIYFLKKRKKEKEKRKFRKENTIFSTFFVPTYFK